MEIVSVEPLVVAIPYAPDGSRHRIAGSDWRTIDCLLVRIETTDGITGWGEAFGYNSIPATRVALETLVAPLCIGRDPLDHTELLRDVRRSVHLFGPGPVEFALSGIDIALWDMRGKVAGVPVHELLGGAATRRVPAYASLMPYRDATLVRQHAQQALEAGYRHIKLHEVEPAIIRDARRLVGPEVELMVDAGLGWTAQQAIDVLHELAPVDLAFVEAPIWPPDDWEAMARARAETDVALATGENATSPRELERMYEAGAIDVAQPSPAKLGGITAAAAVFAYAESTTLRVIPHSAYFGPGFLAAVHLSAALATEPVVERLSFSLETTLYDGADEPVDGELRVPDTPGLGIDPDPDVLRRYAQG